MKVPDKIKIKNKGFEADLLIIVYSDKKEKVHYAYCPSLDLLASGDNAKEAETAMTETLELYFDFAIKEETIDKELKKLGWERHNFFKSKYNPPAYNVNHIMSIKGINEFKTNKRSFQAA